MVAVVALVAPRPANTTYRWQVVVPTVVVLLVLAAVVRLPGWLLSRGVPFVASLAGGTVAAWLGLQKPRRRYSFGHHQCP